MNINWSRMNTYQRCPRRYFWKYVQNLEKTKMAYPLILGRAVHEGLAAHYASKPVKPEIDAIFEEELAKPLLGAEKEELKKLQDYAQFIIMKYITVYASEPWTMLAPEVEGNCPLGRHKLFFRLDGAVTMKGNPWLLEHKTTIMIGNTYFKQYTLDGQITTYMYALEKILSIQPVGVIINVIRKTRNMQGVEFQRDAILRPPGFISSFMDGITWQADQIEERTSECFDLKDEWPMYTHDCLAFFRTCDYMELCRNDSVAMRKQFSERPKDYADED